MIGYRTELRRSPLRWWFPLLVLLDLAAIFGRGRWWIGEWPMTSVQAQIPAFYLAPLLAAAAAWAAGRTGRNGLRDQLAAAARPRPQVEFAQLAAALTYGLLAYALGAAVAAGVSLPTAGPGFLWPGYLLLGAALMVSFAAAGHLAGRTFPGGFATPVACGLGGFIVIAWAAGPQQLGLFAINGAPFRTVSWPALAVRLALAGLLLAGAVGLRRPGGRSAGRRALAAVAFGAALVVVTVALTVTVPLQVDRAAPAQPLCTTGAPTICLWPEDRNQLLRAQAMADRMRQLPTALVTLPARPIAELGLGRGGSRDPEGFYVLEGDMWDPAQTMAGDIMEASRPQGCPDPAVSAFTPEFYRASGELMMWLTMRIYGGPMPATMHGGPPSVDLGAVADVVRGTDAEQLAWAGQRSEVIHRAYCG
ncbi:hypothetical protein [Kitasatospora sp. NPDC094015]|uniref:hypothetical protein n=1 Tax=Kitasatospora sp. NPDC094015 TaxID=3155205 RepID=UPI003317BD9D